MSKAPTLLIVSSEFPPGPGGIGTHAYQVGWQLQRLGWQVSVMSPQDYVSADEVSRFNAAVPLDIHHVDHVPSTAGEFVHRSRMLLGLVDKIHPDMIIATGERSVWLTAFCRGLRKFRWTAIGHGTEFAIPSRWQAALTRRAFSAADAVICVSQYTRAQMMEYGVQPKREMVIPNGADDRCFKLLAVDEIKTFQAERDLRGKHLLVTVGNVTERKGQDIVIRALPAVCQHFPNTLYLIIGLPTKQAEYQALAQQLGVSDHVHFLGRVPQEEVVRYLNACSVFVMTSRHTSSGDFEGYGIAVVEAALCGKPSVVANNSGLVEAIIDGETGIAVPEDDSDATAEAVITLLADDAQRARMGDAAYQRATGEQTWEKRVLIYDEFLRRLLS